MIKKAKSFVTLSLGVAITSQNMIISSADEVAILSDDEFKVKINTNDNNSNSTEINKFDEYQVDPEEEITYSMGGSLGRSLSSVANLETTTLSNPKSIGSGNVTTDNLNVRSGPSSSNSLMGTLKINSTVEILGRNNNWYKIDYNGKEGYVSSSYITLNPLEKGIDVSKWNGSINWQSVKNSGVDYVIIRAGYGNSTVDSQFKNYIEGAINAGLKIGIYWFSYATSAAQARLEAQMCLNTISPYKKSINYPVFFDFEYESVSYARKNGVTITKNLGTQIANSFLNTVKSQGYISGIYTNKDFSSHYFSDDLLNSNNLWVAQYNSNNTFGRPFSMWQYSEKGSVPGIKGAVDLNYTCLKTWNATTSSDSNNTPSIDKPSTISDKGTTTDNLNFRKSASTSSNILATIPKNTSIEILDKSISGWYKVKYKNQTGYISSKYVTLNNNSNNSTPTTSDKGTTTDNLNFRKSASTSSIILATIPKNTSIEILDKSISGWYKVKYKNQTGYISSKYVTLNNNNSTSSTNKNQGVTTTNLNFRKSASTSSLVLYTIPKNTTLEILDKLSSGWYKVKYKGLTGYVSGSYVK